MREQPPSELIELMSRLRLATAVEIDRAYGPAKQLARNWPLFQSVWIDALVRRRRLTPYQAAEINAGRGPQLSIGPYVVAAPLQSLGYAKTFTASKVGAAERIHLLVAAATGDRHAEMHAQLLNLKAKLAGFDDPEIVCPTEVGLDGDRLWISYPAHDAVPIGDWVLQNGRLPGEAVLELARHMTAAMAKLESTGLVHGDLSASAVHGSRGGAMRITRAGVRPVLRPDEGFAHADLPLEAYDYLAPERIRSAADASVAADLFAGGCLWWKLATGRAPLSGGDVLGKLRAAQAAKIPDIRRLAPDCPKQLVEAIAVCTVADPRRRPASFAQLAEMLGQPSSDSRQILRRALTPQRGRVNGRSQSNGATAIAKQYKTALMAIAGCIAMLAVVSWPLWASWAPRDVARIKLIGSREAGATTETDAAKNQPQRKSTPVAIVDPAITLASYAALDDHGARHAPQPQNGKPGVTPLILPAGGMIRWNATDLKAGQIVRGDRGQRPTIVVPPHGILIAKEDVRLENIDFVWRPRADEIDGPENLSLIDLRASRISFVGCTFQAAPIPQIGQPVAIRWTATTRRGSLPPAGRLQFADCIYSGVSAGVDCNPAAPLGIEWVNSLHLGPGPLMRFGSTPKPDEPLEIVVRRSTVRNASALAEFHSDGGAVEPGAINIIATDCAFAPAPGGSLIDIVGRTDPAPLARSLQWTGAGSLLTIGTSVALAHRSRAPNSLDPSEVEINVEGLVGSRPQFAGPADGGATASRITRWQASGKSDQPPGIGGSLPDLPHLPAEEENR